jgi:hypothetical protein
MSGSGVVLWLKNHFIGTSLPTGQVKFIETALFQVVHRLEKSLKHKENALGAFLGIEGAFDNTSFHAIVEAARGHGLEETCCRWIASMLESRLIHTSLMGSSLTARFAGRCPQGSQECFDLVY